MNEKIQEILTVGDPMERWLADKTNPNTQRVYRMHMNLFLGYLKTTPTELMEVRKKQLEKEETASDMDRIVKQFFLDLLEGKVPPTYHKYLKKSAWAIAGAVCSFFKFQGHRYEIRLDVSDKQLKPRPTKIKYSFTREDLQKMLSVASPRDKALILIGCSAGWSAGDVLELTVPEIQSIVNQMRLLEKQRIKTSSPMFLALTKETTNAIKLYLASDKQFLSGTKKEKVNGKEVETIVNPKGFLFPGYKDSPLDVSQVDVIIKTLARKAGIISLKGRPIRFHGLRAYFTRVCKTNGMSEPAVKMLQGHELEMGGAYETLTPEQIWKEFERLEPYLTISPNVEVNGVQKTVEALQEELKQTMLTRAEEIGAIKDYQKLIEEYRNEIQELKERLKLLETK
jgi:integrase